jgi:sigma-B regulation protein RsbU (phosphoserine phosphatase)
MMGERLRFRLGRHLAPLFVLAAMGMLWVLPCTGLAQDRAGRDRATFDATHLQQPVDLAGTWLLHAGDDPEYARPDFDDSSWLAFDPSIPIKRLFSGSRPEIIWYRVRVRVDPAQSGLGLREQMISHAYEVYLNGDRLMTSGQVKPFVPYTMGAQRVQPIPDRVVKTGAMVIALRVRLSPVDWTGEAPGYFATNLTLGRESELIQQDWLTVLGDNLLKGLDVFLLVSVGVVGLVLFAAQRQQYEYLWLFGLGMIQVAEIPYEAATLFHEVPYGWKVLSCAFTIASPLCWASLYFSIVGRRIGLRFRLLLVVAGLLAAYNNLTDLLPSPPGSYGLLINLPFVVLLSVVVPILLIVHMRRGNREAGILLIPVLFFSLYLYAKYALALLFELPGWHAPVLKALNLIDRYHWGPITVSLNQVSGILSTVSLALIMLLRATRTSRRQALLEGELAAAQQVQQVLVPEHAEPVPGFVVESAYQPAQQVGGDFFQILPTENDGLLLVLGDVAGKGLPAAMMVSLLVGAIRTAAEDSPAPEILLRRLNERLVGRSGDGFSTALAAHITADGRATIANAGHLSPYLDGREIDLPGALPLGIASGVRYTSTEFYVPPGSRLTFYSDGVIEAQNAHGELFGFERGGLISTQPAAAIVEAAKEFGQSDDITVVTIARVPVFELASAS